jgi:hypothetical protein
MGVRAPRFLRRVIALFTWSTRNDDMDREMTFHIDSLTREYVRAGMKECDAESFASDFGAGAGAAIGRARNSVTT